ncbi:MAG TPA: flagellar basal body rod C-terminal domain-containing protein, partial [Burkholderiaceae bacterium]|nr:flagellar basal body rod C-terminal domain-containing protein [Burkholderiaceae bacterium]
ANDQQALGVDRNGATGQPLFSVGAPEVLPRTGNPGTATLSASVVNSSALEASDYRIDYDGTNFSVTRLADGQSSTFASLPATIDGLTLSSPSGTFAAGDKFLLRPTAPATRAMSVTLVTPASIAAARPVVAEGTSTNTGGASASVAAVASNANLTQTVTLTFTSAGTFDVNGTGTGNPTGVAFTPGSTISYNGWSLTLNGAPRAGDVFTVRLNPAPSSDNRNALSMADQRDARLIGGDRTSDAYATLLGEVGARVQSADSAREIAQRIADDAKLAQSNASGVNLDEEAARMLQYQQAYQAAAKVISAAQTLFDSLLSAVS